MTLRAIIIDDEETGVETLRVLIDRYIDEMNVVAQTTNASEAIVYIENYKPEVVFLDISMPEMDGFELLNQLRWRNFHLIFTTAHQQHALRAIKSNAADYLLKPIDPKELQMTITRIRQQMSRQDGGIDYSFLNTFEPSQVERLAVTSKSGVEYVYPKDILCFESQSNYTLIFLLDGKTILTPKTLGEFELQFCDGQSHFMRVHHSYIINLRKLLRYVKEEELIVMADHRKIPLSKSRKESFMRWLKP
jgi:two-component system LytT family response regulator